MELGLNNSLLQAGDQRLIDHIVGEVKSQGIFDQFRKECLADVDTKPAYQNLRTRVESSVNTFLNKQTWKTDLNKNQLRETLRKHIHEAPYLEVGVERIVDQVVHPKVYSVFMPQIEDVVYKFLGIERPKSQKNGACDLKDLLPKDLDPVSPESDRNSLKDVSLESIDENVVETTNEADQKLNSSSSQEKVQDTEEVITKKDNTDMENGENTELASSPVKTVLNSSFKSDETNKTEEEEEDSPVFEPIDIMNLNESNMSNDSHLSGISELTSHRSRSPDFMTEFSRDNFDNSNQDSQLSKVSSNSRLSIVTDFGSSNHASTPAPESKEDSKNTKDNLKDTRESDFNKDKFNFEVMKVKESSKSISSKENSRDASEYKDSKSKDEVRLKNLKDKHDSKTNRDKDQNSRRRHSNKYSRSKSKDKDKNESESQESKENSGKVKESKVKEIEKKEEPSKEVKDLKDLYKEKIRELREKKELTEKEKLGKEKESTKGSKDLREKKDSSSLKEKDDYKKSHKSSSSSSSRSSSYHNSKSSKSSESKESRDKVSSKRDDRYHSNGKNESRSSSKSKRDSKSDGKSENRSSDRSLKDKKRRDEKKSKSTDDHSSLRKNSNDRRSTDRDGSNGSSSKYSQKSPYGANNSGKLGPAASLPKDNNRDHHSGGETVDNIHDSLELMFADGGRIAANCNSNNPPKRVDPGTTEICLPLKKRPLLSEDSSNEEGKSEAKKSKVTEKKATKKKIEKDIFKIDTDVASVPDEERVQIIEVPDEEYEQPYPDEEPILSLEETKKIILDAEPIHPTQSKLSEMEQSIRQSLNEMMSDHKLIDSENTIISSNLTPVMDSNTLLDTLTGESNDDSGDLIIAEACQEKVQFKSNEIVNLNVDKVQNNSIIEKSVQKIVIGEQKDTTVKEYIQSDEVNLEITDHNVNVKEHSHQPYETTIEQINLNIGISKIQSDQKSIESIILIDKERPENDANVNIKEEDRKEEESKNFVEKPSILHKENTTDEVELISIINKPSVENADQDEDSTDDNTDEFNEDHKLVIDEEFDEKGSNNDSEMNISSENESANEIIIKSCKSNQSTFELEKINKKSKNTLNEKSFDDDSIDDDDVKIIKINQIESSEKPIQCIEDEQKLIKDRLIDELGKLNEDESDIEKPIDNEVVHISDDEKINSESLAQDERNETDVDRSIKKFDDLLKDIDGSENKEVIDKNTDRKINKEVSKDNKIDLNQDEDDDDNQQDKANELIIICEEKETEEAQETEDELTLIFNDDSSNEAKTPALSKESEVDNKIAVSLDKNEVKTYTDFIEETEINLPTTSKDKLNRTAVVVSPFEEDCYYLDSHQSHQRYLKFQKFLEKLETDPKRSLEDMIESYGGVVVSAMPMAAPTAPPLLKRKLSTSPVGDIVETNTMNNNIEGSIKETSNEEVGDDAISAIKKRKVGRAKKANTSSSATSTGPPSQQQQPTLQQPHQQPQVTLNNGENFVMPLSPDSDVSATSDKNPANILKDERSHRSGHSRSNQQRYSSDDLYKPRPLFSSTSRRNRRFNQA